MITVICCLQGDIGSTMEEYILGSTKQQPRIIDHFKTVVLSEDNRVNLEYLERVENNETFDWFNSRTINEAMDVLRKQFPVAAGLQGICSSGDHFLIKNHSFLQILRKATRYILISAWNMENGHVNVFDPSSMGMVISDNTEKRIANLMAYHNTSSKLHVHIIHLGRAVKQEYSGVICVAIAVYILTGSCPGMIDLTDVDSIVDHMTNCLKEKRFSPCNKRDVEPLSPCFGNSLRLPPIGYCTEPLNGKDLPSTVYEIQKEIPLHCLCHRPHDEYMKPCNKCKSLFHEICIKRFGCLRGKFLCPDCVGKIDSEKILILPHRILAFDAYISYKCSDLWFIKQYLIPKLEWGAMYNHRLAINERDFMPGHCYVDEIIEKLALSRQCLVVVSQDFLFGSLKLFEWDQIVRHRWFSLKVILIDPYEEVMAKCGKISKCFEYYLEQQNHLEWKENMTKTEERRFWNCIHQFLGVPLIHHRKSDLQPRFFHKRSPKK